MKNLLLILIFGLTFMCHDAAASNRYRAKNISAENIFSDPITLGQSGGVLTLTGTWSATVKLQRKDVLGNWSDVTNNAGSAISFTDDGTFTIFEPTGNADYRFGVDSGDYTSGTVVGVIEGK